MAEHADFFKYSPAFALFMGMFAFLPDLAGLMLWNVLNWAVLVAAVTKVPALSRRQTVFVLLFCLPEMVLSTQASQSNLLMAGLLILAFTNLEGGRPTAAALCIVAGTFIKLFAAAGVILFLFYPNKLRFMLAGLFWTVFFLLIPLVAVPASELLLQYSNWFALLGKDHSRSAGMSVFAFFSSAGTGFVKRMVLLAGALLLLLPLLRIRVFRNYLPRLCYLCVILIWIVIFNHKGESPTYVIAMTGCALWGATFANRSLVWPVLSLTLLLTSVIKTDLLPRYLRSGMDLNAICVVMPFLVLIIILYLIFRSEPDEMRESRQTTS
ncbi:MAG TPA: glycosyltransferase family 87 protein, partial [Chitinophagaceae bacterium]|nr:glycosyltransferase family 87 protein [Chitinophagaceae bacterium]